MEYLKLLIFACGLVLANGGILKSGIEKKSTSNNPQNINHIRTLEERQLATTLGSLASGTGAAAGALLTPLLGSLGPVISAAGGALGCATVPLLNGIVNQLGGLFSSSVDGNPVPIASYNAYLVNLPDYGRQVVLLNAATPLGFRSVKRQPQESEKHIAFNTKYEINTPLASQLQTYLQYGYTGQNGIEQIPNTNHFNTGTHDEDNSDHIYATNPVEVEHHQPQTEKPGHVEEHLTNGQGLVPYDGLVAHIEHLAQLGIPLDSIGQVLEILKKKKLAPADNTERIKGKNYVVDDNDDSEHVKELELNKNE